MRVATCYSLGSGGVIPLIVLLELKNIGVPYNLDDISKAPTASVAGAFVFGWFCAIIPHSAKTCQVDILELLTLNRINPCNYDGHKNRRKKAHLKQFKWAFLWIRLICSA